VHEIPLAPELAHVLKAWKLACPITDLKLVFPSDRGKPVSGKLIDKYVFRPAHAAAGFDRPAAKDINFHGLRHTFATTLLGDGVAPFIVSRLVGHASVAFTMARYGHWTQRGFEPRAQTLDFALTFERTLIKYPQLYPR
jgi:integrase